MLVNNTVFNYHYSVALHYFSSFTALHCDYRAYNFKRHKQYDRNNGIEYWYIGVLHWYSRYLRKQNGYNKFGGLQLPYLLWTAFAGYLNAGVWLLN